MKKRVLITGGSGFIGTHLARALSQQGDSVTVLDLRDPEQPVPGVLYVRGDVREASDLKPLIPKQDAVFHFAAIVSVPECQSDPVGSYETNTFSTLKILGLIHEENKKREVPIRFLFSSSSAVYGDQGATPGKISEDRPLPTPVSFYGAQKLASEQMIQLYAGQYRVPSVIFRFFNVFGPGQKSDSPYSGVISLFVRKIAQGEVLPLNGGGSQTRDFISVYDIVAAWKIALESENAYLLLANPMNLGSGQSISIRELATQLTLLAGKPLQIADAPSRAGDILHSCSDISKAGKYLNWKPENDLKAGLLELLRPT
jgi:UDP-glucose 4-epimerase